MHATSKALAAIGLLALGTPFIAAAQAATISYTDFSSVAGLTLNGHARPVGDVLRLTPAQAGRSGSAFSTAPITLTGAYSFSTHFRFRISEPGGISDIDGRGADGIVFVVQTNANDVGGLGGGIGYQGIPNSVGIEFDTWYNPELGDIDGNHVGIDLNGDIHSVARVPFATRLNDGDIWNAWIDYDGTLDLLEVRLAGNGARPDAALLSHTVDLAAVLNVTDAFVGFTSGTGSAFGNHDILSWEFRDNFDPIDTPGATVPVPGSLALLGLGLLSLAGVRRAGAYR